MAPTQELPHFPNDIFQNILKHLNEEQTLPFLWITCRGISQTFKSIIEEIFIRDHLSNTMIKIKLGRYEIAPEVYWEKEFREHIAEFKFSKLLQLGERSPLAVFTLQPTKFPEADKDLLEKITIYINNLNTEYPKHRVEIGRRVYDSPLTLVIFSFIPIREGLRVNWIKLFNSFYGEAKVHDSLEKKTPRPRPGALNNALKARRKRLEHEYELAHGFTGFYRRGIDLHKEHHLLQCLQSIRQDRARSEVQRRIGD